MPIPKWEQPLQQYASKKTNSNHYYSKPEPGIIPIFMISKTGIHSYVVSDYRAPRYSFEWKKKMVLW
jgi:hypothetical protein